MSEFRDRRGERFGALEAVEPVVQFTPSGRKETLWKMTCDCGAVVTRRINNVIKSPNPSCGCLGKTQPGEAKQWLENHVTYTGNECLQFPYCRSRAGYGAIGFGGFVSAHRWMCHQAHGQAPSDKPFALHKCGNGRLGCVNPKHLYWGDGVDNYNDQIRHGVAARGERCGRTRLTADDVKKIRFLRGRGLTHKAIAKTIGAEKDAVRSVLRGRTWAWL